MAQNTTVDKEEGWTPEKLWPVENIDPLMIQLHDILCEHNALGKFRMAIQSALNLKVDDICDPEEKGGLNIKTPFEYIKFMNDFLYWVPTEQRDGRWIYKHICALYFIFNQPSLYCDDVLQNPITPASVRKTLKPITQWLVNYAKQVGNFLDQPESWGKPGQLDSFKQACTFHVDRYIIPEGPDATFNDFFSRKLKVPNPVDGKNDRKIIVSPADCTYASYVQPIEEDNEIVAQATHQEGCSTVTLKTLTWRIQDLLFPSKWENVFKGGSFVHAFLGPSDYHRKHTPVSGKVVYARVVQGQCYLEVITEKTPDGGTRLLPVRPIAPYHPDKARTIGAGKDRVDLDAIDGSAYQFLQTRGVIIIDTEDPAIGYVGVIPVGMAQVSSVNLSVSEGDKVTKGDELSYFLFGGSDIIMLFEKKAHFELDSDIVANIQKAEKKGQTVTAPVNHFRQGQRIGEVKI